VPSSSILFGIVALKMVPPRPFEKSVTISQLTLREIPAGKIKFNWGMEKIT